MNWDKLSIISPNGPPRLNIRMRTVTHAIALLTMILIACLLSGCARINSTVENGIGQVPGQRVYVSTTVYRW